MNRPDWFDNHGLVLERLAQCAQAMLIAQVQILVKALCPAWKADANVVTKAIWMASDGHLEEARKWVGLQQDEPFFDQVGADQFRWMAEACQQMPMFKAVPGGTTLVTVALEEWLRKDYVSTQPPRQLSLVH